MGRPWDWAEVFGFEDPTPGEVHEIASLARRWSDVADEAEYAEVRLRGLLGDGAVTTWIGQAGEAFRSQASELPDQLAKTKRSYRQACEALSWWAGRLELHQGDADAALVRGRAAKAELESALQQVTVTGGQVGAASSVPVLHHSGDRTVASAPTREQVSAAMSRLASARAAAAQAQAWADDAQARLDAARALAAEAGQLRVADGRVAAERIHEAADAGIAPRSFWSKAGQALASAWHVVVTVAKVVVAVLGVVALIIGGPLAWVVLAAALLVLADTLMKYAKGQASLVDVGLALLICIPGTKGLTTLGKLTAAYKAGGTLGAGAHLLVAGKAAIVGLARAVADIPRVAAALRKGLVPSLKAAVQVLGRPTTTVTPTLNTTVQEMAGAFWTSMAESRSLLHEAHNWQGVRAFPGRDAYTIRRLESGSVMEAGFPGLGNYAMPQGAAAATNYSAGHLWESVQVGPNVAFGGYRGAVVELHVNTPLNVATGITLANPAYGAGGQTQYFLDITHFIAKGDVSVIDAGGSVVSIPDALPASGVNAFLAERLGNGPIQLSGAQSWGQGVLTQQEVVALNQHLPGYGPQHLNLPGTDLGRVPQILRAAGYVGVGPEVSR